MTNFEYKVYRVLLLLLLLLLLLFQFGILHEF